ncbi:MAG TPA: universal stress protein [Puia sp.]|nr:universal stress protein [Puia sp.]
MRKILLTIDALNINAATIDFACYIARLTRSKLTGVFLENILYEEVEDNAYVSAGSTKGLSYNQRQAIAEQNILFFKEACEKRSVQASIHRDRGFPINEIVEESRFADLLIIEPSVSFKKKLEGSPSGFVKSVLAEAECPVIIAPESFDGVHDIVFAYDGSKSAVFAMKQFTYLFPELSDKKVTLLEVDKHSEFTVREKPKIIEWLKSHYADMHIEMLTGTVEEELFKHLIEKKDLIVVMGAFGRNAVSTFFKESRATLIMRATNLPIFITHH